MLLERRGVSVSRILPGLYGELQRMFWKFGCNLGGELWCFGWEHDTGTADRS